MRLLEGVIDEVDEEEDLSSLLDQPCSSLGLSDTELRAMETEEFAHDITEWREQWGTCQ